MIDMTAIYTDASGRPFERPEPPAANATIDERIAYTRAVAAYRDAITDAANATFSTAFRSALRRTP